MAQQSDPSKNIEARRKYAAAFNDTLLKIWRERIIKLKAMDSGALIRSLEAVRFKIDEYASEVDFAQEYRAYGIFVEAGTGREVPKDNPGDIGRAKVRKPKPWMYKKYYMSFRNILEMFAESFGLQAMAVITNALDKENLRGSVYKKSLL